MCASGISLRTVPMSKHGEKRCKRTTAHRCINRLRVQGSVYSERHHNKIQLTHILYISCPSPFVVPLPHQTTYNIRRLH